MNINQQIELLTIEELSNYLKTKIKCIYNLIHDGKKGKPNGIPPWCYKKIGKHAIFIKSRIDQWILSADTTEEDKSQDVA